MAAPSNTQFAVAIHVLTLLTGHRDTPMSSDAMAESVGANPVYLRRVLGRLRETGFVDSRPGPKGGWHLTQEPDAITLGDVWRAIQDDAPIFGLHATAPECPVGNQITVTLSALDDRLTRTVVDELDRTTIAQVIPHDAMRLDAAAAG
jgi:Rrf2 family protein